MRSQSKHALIARLMFAPTASHAAVPTRVVQSFSSIIAVFFQALMAEHADAFLVMPGGWGTLDESMEILTWR